MRANLEAEVNQFRLKELHLSDGMVYDDQNVAQGIWMLARSNYEVQFQAGQQLSERIIFPATPSQRNGIEDARFVYFKNDDGTHTYYATFTAFDGKVIIGQGGADFGMRGYVSAYDQETGKEVWRFYVVPASPEANQGDAAMEAAATGTLERGTQPSASNTASITSAAAAIAA